MTKKINNIILFNTIKNDEDLINLSKKIENNQLDISNIIPSFFSKLISFAQTNKLEGNIYQLYLAYKLICDENSFTLACENNEIKEDESINEFAKNDIEIVYLLSKANISYYLLGNNILNYVNINVQNSEILNKLKLIDFSTSANLLASLKEFYKKYGIGKFAFFNAFNLDTDGKINPVTNIKVTMDTLIGYKDQKEQIINNTISFINNKPANNVLLYGEAGTGKSTCIKAIANMFSKDGVRLIEIYKHQFRFLPKLIQELKNRNYKFIIYMDDLSFEEFETDYKYLKAVIEGGVEERPKNCLIYASSNRRHLIKETWKDRELDNLEIHRTDTMQEKISLASRFGIMINFSKPTKDEYNNIVIELAKKEGIDIEEKELLRLSNIWELSHGGVTGRVARQFIDFLLGK